MGLDLTALAGQPAMEDDDPITGFLRRLMATRGAAGGGIAPAYGSPFRSPIPSFMAGRVAPRPAPVAPAASAAAAAPSPGIADAASALGKRSFPATMLPFEGPSTKTAPGGSLKFAWGAGTPEDYKAGQTDILKMEGAPAARSGFMGAEPVSRGSGGFAPSETDWSKVANPMAFDAYREKPLRDEIERAAKDPLWRERELKELDVAGAERVARAEAEAQIQAQANEARRVREEIDRLTQEEINRQNQARAASGQKPLTPDDEERLRSQIGLRFGVGFGLR